MDRTLHRVWSSATCSHLRRRVVGMAYRLDRWLLTRVAIVDDDLLRTGDRETRLLRPGSPRYAGLSDHRAARD